jgi:uncharacterized protein
MGWRGSGGSAVATTGATLWFGGMLLILAGVGEFILGNSFPFIVFMGYGAHFLTYGVTFMPFYNAIDAYTAQGAGGQPQFYASFGECLTTAGQWLRILTLLSRLLSRCDGVTVVRVPRRLPSVGRQRRVGDMRLLLTYVHARTNLFFLLIFVVATIGFSFAAAGFFALAAGNAAFGATMIVATGACFFAASCFGWYLLLAAIIEIQEIPIPSLPVVDLSTHIKAKSLVRAAKDAKRRS